MFLERLLMKWGGSEYFSKFGYQGGKVPVTNPKKNLKIYQQYAEAVESGLVSSGIGINRGGLGVALSKMAIAGKLGIKVDLKEVKGQFTLDQEGLFSESTGRILLTIDPKNKIKFESIMKDVSFSLIGEVSQIDDIKIKGLQGKEIVSIKIGDALDSYKKRFKDW